MNSTKLLICLIILTMSFQVYLMINKGKTQDPTFFEEYKLEIQQNYLKTINYTYSKLNSDIKFYNDSGIFYIKDLVKSELTFVFYYSEKNCQKCVVEELNKVQNFLPKMLSKDIIVVQRKYSNGRSAGFPSLFQSYYVDNNFFELGIDVDKTLEKAPLMFVVNKNLEVTFVCIPNKEAPYFSTIFLSRIKKIFESIETKQ